MRFDSRESDVGWEIDERGGEGNDEGRVYTREQGYNVVKIQKITYPPGRVSFCGGEVRVSERR